MAKEVKVAIIDNGVNEIYIKGIVKSITVDEQGICIDDTSKMDHQYFQHGTNCAMILKKYCPDCRVISIRILDEKGIGAVKSIYPALEWCLKNHVRLVNLSLGTSDFRDCGALKTLINEYVAKGLIIVAATANSGVISYPASFTNVIGVAAVDSPVNHFMDYVQLGIDAVVPSEHMVRVYNYEDVKTSQSNSYAAPYVSALIANRLKENNTLDIIDLKRYSHKQSYVEMADEMYEPDWVYKAYIVGNGKMSFAKYYFETIEGEFNEIPNEADTVIAFSKADLKKLDIKNKNLIYLGKENIGNADVKGFFWSREIRYQQIVNNCYQGNGIDIPMVILAVEATIDDFYVLTELRGSFANDGYNACVIGMEPECVLYALEYMPEPVSNHEVWKNFIESLIFYKQCDLVIWCIPLEDRDKFIEVYPDYDVEIRLCNEGENVKVRFSFGEEYVEKHISKMIDREDVEEIYYVIKTKLTEDKDG